MSSLHWCPLAGKLEQLAVLINKAALVRCAATVDPGCACNTHCDAPLPFCSNATLEHVGE